MRLVLDTNVLIAAFISRGHCRELLEHTATAHQLFTSEPVLREFGTVLSRKFQVPPTLIENAVDLQRSRMGLVEPAPLASPASRDPDDDVVLATAVAAQAVCLISGDRDLLDLQSYGGIRILPPASFWEFESRLRGT